MFNSFRDLRGFRIRAADEPEGSVNDLYFDDEEWCVRYFVADLGFWVFGHQGLIGVRAVGKPDLRQREIPVKLTAEDIRDASRPAVNSPVSEQERRANLAASYDWPPLLLGASGSYTPAMAERQIREVHRADGGGSGAFTGSSHLRSMKELIGYHVAARDGEIGTVDDFLINPLDWKLRYYVIDTGHWLPGRKVVLATEWTTHVDWPNRRVVVDVTRHQIESSPPPEEVGGLTRSVEERLYRRDDVTGFWPG